eukprot:COSAG05_NODE_14794_length_387_cov_0.538194_1_plen_108_part_10
MSRPSSPLAESSPRGSEGPSEGGSEGGVLVMPDEMKVDHVAYNQLLDETKCLQEQLNAKQAERKSKQELFESLQMGMHVVNCDLATPDEAGRSKYLQQQLWMLEQAYQ